MEEDRHDEREEARARSEDEFSDDETVESEAAAEAEDDPAPGQDDPRQGGGPMNPALAGAGGEHHGPTNVDAMGLDKHRQVIGRSYGPTKTRQLAVFAIFFACVGVLFIGGKLLAGKLDEPPETNPDKAPWSKPDAPQRPAHRPM